MQYDLLSFGSAVVDKIFCVDEEFLEKVDLVKGNSQARLNKSHDDILKICPSKNMLSIAGGSAGNATKIVAGYGFNCGYIARVGKDKWGQFYKNSFIERGVTPLFSECEKSPTGSLLCFITPDGERTMYPDNGACWTISKKDIHESYFENARLFHMDGFNLNYKEALYEAVRLAIKKRVPISYDLSSFELMRSHNNFVKHFLKKKFLTFLFGNEREAFELTGITNPIDACRELSKYCPTVTIMMGERGSVTIDKGLLYSMPTKPIKPLDTTGAGDMFIGGFLSGYLSGFSTEKCMSLGTTTAAKGIQVFGGELPLKHLKQLRESLMTPSALV